MDHEFIQDVLTFSRHQLENVVSFWLQYGRDSHRGGYCTCLGRNGESYSHIKPCMWSHGRMIWFFSKLYNEWKSSEEYLDMARHGIDYALSYGFDETGRPYYAIDDQNRPMQWDPTVFTELSYVLGFSEFARATGDTNIGTRAWQLFENVWNCIQEPKQAHSNSSLSYSLRLHGHAMITLNVLQELRLLEDRTNIDTMIDTCLDLILNYHTKQEEHATFELVHWDGRKAPDYLGRWINPGHMIEGGIFIMHEANHRQDEELQKRGVELIDWGWEWGWDEEYGGLFNDVDQLQKPMIERAYLGSDKLWWQHAEAFYGLILAYRKTGHDRFKRRWEQLRNYIEKHFIDSEVEGDWFTLLDRRGNRIDDSKGSHRKNSFHIGRNLFWIIRLLV